MFTSSNHLLPSTQDKGCSTPTLAHSLALPHGPGLLNISIIPFPEKNTEIFAIIERTKTGRLMERFEIQYELHMLS